MPLNEAGPPRSRLTKQQKHEALAAIYGLSGVPAIAAQVTETEIEDMRSLLSEHKPAEAREF